MACNVERVHIVLFIIGRVTASDQKRCHQRKCDIWEEARRPVNGIIPFLILYILPHRVLQPIAHLSNISIVIATIKLSLDRLRPYFKAPQYRLGKVEGKDYAVLLNDITVYNTASVLFGGFSHEVPSDGTILILGKNGVGKSRLLKTILGMTHPIQEVYWSSSLLDSLQISYITQSIPIFNENLYNNIALGATISHEEVVAMLRRTGWKGRIDLDVMYSQEQQPSGGERQRIGVVRALLSRPQVIVADEVESGLDDPEPIIQLITDSTRLRLVATHRPELWHPTDETWLIRNGKCQVIKPLQLHGIGQV